MAGPDAPQIFISYAWADGRATMELLRARLPLLLPGCRAWTDDRVDPAARTFTLEIQQALDESAAALFVMTAASRVSVWCEKEIEYAASLKLPYAVIQPRADVRLPFSLTGSPVVIPLADGDDRGWDRLQRFLGRLGSPVAHVEELEEERQRVTAAAARVSGPDRPRYDVRARELADSIAGERARIADPVGTQRRRQAEISRDLAAEQEPAPDPADGSPVTAAGVRLINDLPGLPLVRFHDRDEHLRRLTLLLSAPEPRLIALTGPDGMGKTALLNRLKAALGRDPLSGYRAVVLLDACGHRRVTAATVLLGLARAVDDASMSDVLDRLDQPMTSTDKLTTVLQALGDRAVLVVVDGAEELLGDGADLKDADLREVCAEIAVREGHHVRMLFTTQRLPEPLMRELGARAAEVALDAGLPMPAAGDFLRMLDGASLLGDAATDDAFLSRLQRVTNGRPRSLELFYGILLAEPVYTTPLRLLEQLEGLPPRSDIGSMLYERMLNDLFDPELRVVEALAAYGRPVLPGAVDHVLDEENGVPAVEPLGRLVARQLVRRDGDRYYLPARDGERTVDRLRRNAPGVLLGLRRRAAGYHRRSRTPNRRIRQVADLDGHLAEVEMRVWAGEYDAAARVMAELDRLHLRRWGHSAMLLDWRVQVAPHLSERRARIGNLSMAAAARSQQEQFAAAVADLQVALREARFREPEMAVGLLRQLGAVEYRRGALGRSNMLFRRALSGAVLRRLPREQIRARLNLGLGMARVGRFPAALRHLTAAIEQARSQPVGRDVLVRLWLNLGWVHGQMDDDSEPALAANDEAHRVAGRGGQTLLAGVCALGRAEVLVNGEDPDSALELARDACHAGLVARDAALVCDANRTMALVYLRTGRVDEAVDATRTGMLHRSSENAAQLYLLQGIVAFRRGGRRDGARAAFREAAGRAPDHRRTDRRDYQAHDLRALILAGLALCDRTPPAEAVGAFRQARAITRAPGAVRRVDILLQQFDGPADPRMLAELRRAATG